MSVRAKFSVQSVTTNVGYGSVKLTAKYAPHDPQSENGKFWTATPTGAIEMQINVPEALAQFKPGDDFYVTFEKADVPA